MPSGKHVTEHRRYRKQCLCKLLGGKCFICGFSEFVEALEFHHINPQTKKYQLSSGHCHSVQEDIDEARKCVQLCSNCHRGVHAGKLALCVDSVPFDEEYATVLIGASQKYMKVEEYLNPTVRICPRCGNQMSPRATTCRECMHIPKNSHPTKDELESLISIESFCEIGRRYGVSDNTVRKWCKKYGLPSRKRDIQ